MKIQMGVVTALILAATFSRLIPHPWNFTAVGAMALFGAACFSNRLLAFAIPLAAMWLGDVALNNTVYSSLNHGRVWLFPDAFPWVYAAFVLIAFSGFIMLKKVRLLPVIGASLSASVIFFLVTNLGVWMGSTLYPQTVSGLYTCYIAGLPFFWNTVAGDLFYCGILFGAFELAKYGLPALRKEQAA
ncbi:MAG: hypothetical protein HKL88_07350 [Bacteroidia bacterium]|nr:hypothetical protein [Bacteroidia bacterium]